MACIVYSVQYALRCTVCCILYRFTLLFPIFTKSYQTQKHVHCTQCTLHTMLYVHFTIFPLNAYSVLQYVVRPLPILLLTTCWLFPFFWLTLTVYSTVCPPNLLFTLKTYHVKCCVWPLYFYFLLIPIQCCKSTLLLTTSFSKAFSVCPLYYFHWKV